LSSLKHFKENPYINILVGLVLLYSAVAETLRDWDDISNAQISVHHGVIIFAIAHILNNLLNLLEDLECIDRSK